MMSCGIRRRIYKKDIFERSGIEWATRAHRTSLLMLCLTVFFLSTGFALQSTGIINKNKLFINNRLID